jgi:hypothetical protein
MPIPRVSNDVLSVERPLRAHGRSRSPLFPHVIPKPLIPAATTAAAPASRTSFATRSGGCFRGTWEHEGRQ